MKIHESFRKTEKILKTLFPGFYKAIETQKALWKPMSSGVRVVWKRLREVRIGPILDGYRKVSAPPLEKKALLAYGISGGVMVILGIIAMIFSKNLFALLPCALFIVVGLMIIALVYRRYEQGKTWHSEAWEYFKKSTNYKELK